MDIKKMDIINKLKFYLWRYKSMKYVLLILLIFYLTYMFKLKFRHSTPKKQLLTLNNGGKPMKVREFKVKHEEAYRCEEELSLWQHISAKEQTIVDYGSLDIYHPLDLNKNSIPYMKHFKNPCFLQNLTTADPYRETLHDTRLPAKHTRCAQETFQSRLDIGEHVRVRCFPYFFLAGVQKCGTTDLYNILPLHHQITRFTLKENHWWNRGRFKMNGGVAPISMEGYLDLFDTNAESILRDVYMEDGHLEHTMVLGDVSPAMLWDQTFWKEMPGNKGQKEPMVLVPHLIRYLLPDAKFIIILRNPTERLYSDWLFFEQDQKTPQRFDEQVRFAIFWFNNCTRYHPIRACFYNPIDRSPYHSDSFREANPWWHPAFRLRMGLYYIFIADLLSVFPKEQVMIMRLEDYSLNRLHWMKKVFAFLDLEDDPDFEGKLKKSDINNVNTQGYDDYGNMFPQTELLLDNFYKSYNVKLASLLKDPAFDWKH